MLKKLILSLSLVGGLILPASATLVKQLNVVYNNGETLTIRRKKIAEITYTQDQSSSPKTYSINITYNDGTDPLTIDRTQVKKITFSDTNIIPDDLVDMNMIITTSMGEEKNLMWAKYNVGATAENEDGTYFAWGEYTDKSATDGYSWTTYKFTESEDGSTFTKYTADGAVLESADDVATQLKGEEYRLPTHEEWDLLNNTAAYTWSQEGSDTWAEIASGSIANGYRVTCVANGNSIFLPAAGYYKDTTCLNRGVYGAYWSSTLQSGKMAYDVEFGIWGHWITNQSATRFSGHTVRAVSEQ